MGFRTFEAELIIKHGKIIRSKSSDPEKLYPKTFLHFFKAVVLKLITAECHSGKIRIHSKADKLLLFASGDMIHCQEMIIRHLRELFSLDIDAGEDT